MTEMKRLKVFLCHAHSDATAVRDLFRYLRREGVDVWLDKESLLPGADWEFEIRKAVRASDVVVVCLSKQFNQAGFRQKEVRLALDTAMEKPEGEIFIIPARLEECDGPPSLQKWHWVDLFEEGGRQKLVRALRMRADQIGANLRRRKGDKSVEPRPKNNEADISEDPLAWIEKKDDTQATSEGIFIIPELPPEVEPEWVKQARKIQDEQPSEEEPEWVKQAKNVGAEQPAKEKPFSPPKFTGKVKKASEDIRVDRYRNVYRGSEKLGTLPTTEAYLLLKALIYNRGAVCQWYGLRGAIFRSSFLKPFTLSAETKALRREADNIRRLIEEDYRHPKLLIETKQGLKLVR